MKKREVMLIKDVDALGIEGDIVLVSNGYARNYLFPQHLAIPHNAFSRHLQTSRMQKIEHNRHLRDERLGTQKSAIEEKILEINMYAGEDGKLFGSVTPLTIAEHLAERGIHINKSHIKVPGGHIKNTGQYNISITLTPNVHAILQLQINAASRT